MPDYDSPYTAAQVDAIVGKDVDRGTNPATLDLAALGGGQQDFTIPAGVRSFSVGLFGVSRSGTANSFLRLGDAASVKASGYVGSFQAGGYAASPTGILMCAGAATNTHYGLVHFVNFGGNEWSFEGTIHFQGLGGQYRSAGGIALSSALTTVSLQTGGGVFNAGKAAAFINI